MISVTIGVLITLLWSGSVGDTNPYTGGGCMVNRGTTIGLAGSVTGIISCPYSRDIFLLQVLLELSICS